MARFSDRAFEREYSLVFDSFVRWAARRARVDCATAEDLVCEARRVAWSVREKFEPHGGISDSFRRWSGRILVLVCNNFYRTRAKRPVTVAMPTYGDDEEYEPGVEILLPLLRWDLQRCLSDLPRRLFYLLDLHLNGYSRMDISRILHIHPNTVSNRLEEIEQILEVHLPGFTPEVDDGLLRECSQMTLYHKPSEVWDHAGTSRQIQKRRRTIRVTNGVNDPKDGLIWHDRPGVSLSEEYKAVQRAVQAAVWAKKGNNGRR